MTRHALREVFALVDVDAMYVSAERIFNPRLLGKPVAVLSGNDGNVIARSREIKALGVRMGQPWHELKEVAREQGIIALSANFALYSEISNRFVSVLREFSPIVSVYSVDEAFLCVHGMERHWPAWQFMGQEIRRRMDAILALPVCVGFGHSQALAKLANHVAKKQPAYKGVCDLTSLSRCEFLQLLEGLDVEDVWGIGQRTAEQLRAEGIGTARAFYEIPHDWVRARFGVVMGRLWHELHGVPCLALGELPAPKRQIVSSRSFGRMVTAYDDLSSAIASFVTRACEKLRAQNSVCETVQVFIETNRFRTQDDQYANAVSVPLPNPSSDTRAITHYALKGLRAIYRRGYRYKRAGVMLGGIAAAVQRCQSSFFELDGAGQKSEKLMAILDGLNQRFGRDKVSVAAAGGNGLWRPRADRKSPAYITRWGELPLAYAN